MRSRMLICLAMIVLVALSAGCGAAAATAVVEKEQVVEVVVTPTPEPAELARLDPDQPAWLEGAQLGPFAPETQDWDAIKAAAREEVPETIY